MPLSEIWERFREERFPRFVRWIQNSVGREVPVEVDWLSLEEDPRLAESLEYDLEMLARALEGVDTHNPFVEKAKKADPAVIREGIERIRIRQVREIGDSRLEVAGGTLHVDFCRKGFGFFSAREIETLLLDRTGEKTAQWVEAPGVPLSPGLEEFRRYRLPERYRGLERALRRSIPVSLDWPSLGAAPDAAFRLSYVMGELTKVLEKVANPDPGMIAGRESERKRARRRAEERSRIVGENVKRLRVYGGSCHDDSVFRLSAGTVELCVFQDSEYVPRGKDEKYAGSPITEIRRFPGCTARQLEPRIRDRLDLDVAPLLRQVREEDVPKAQAHLLELMDRLIAKGPFKAPDRVRLRELLTAGGMIVEVDWESFLAPEKTEDRVKALRTLETGPFKYNCNYGELFRNLFYAIEEVVRQEPVFLVRFLKRVRTIRYEQVADPGARELIAEGSRLLLCQCLYGQGGVLTDSDLTDNLKVIVTAMAEPAEGREGAEGAGAATGDDAVIRLIRRLVEVLGNKLRVTLDPMLLKGPEAIEGVSQRVLAPLYGAICVLMDQAGYAEVLRRLLLDVRIRHVESPEEKRCSYHEGLLIVSCCPGRGAAGCFTGGELENAIDDGLALRVRAEIKTIERENRTFWQRMLRERFDRDITLEVDWAAFLAHPAEGGNRLYPLNVRQAGVERLIYALTGWMDDDENFKARARERINRLIVTSAPDASSRELLAEGDAIVYRCSPGIRLQGYFTIDELQQHLYRLIGTKE
jgi:hypothetical protein